MSHVFLCLLSCTEIELYVSSRAWQQRNNERAFSASKSVNIFTLLDFLGYLKMLSSTFYFDDLYSLTIGLYIRPGTDEINAESMTIPIPKREVGWFGFHQDSIQDGQVPHCGFFFSRIAGTIASPFNTPLDTSYCPRSLLKITRRLAVKILMMRDKCISTRNWNENAVVTWLLSSNEIFHNNGKQQ